MTEPRPGNVLACPNCLSASYLGENVQGWRGLRFAPRMVDGAVVVHTEFEVHDVGRVSWFCSNQPCNLDRELRDSDLVQLDDQGMPISDPAPEQERLAFETSHAPEEGR